MHLIAQEKVPIPKNKWTKSSKKLFSQKGAQIIINDLNQIINKKFLSFD